MGMQEISVIMDILNFIVPGILAALLTGGIVWIMSYYFMKVIKTLLASNWLNFVHKKSIRNSLFIIATLVLVFSIIIGFKEMVYLYLSTGNYGLIILLTLGTYGLLFIVPFYSLTTPLIFKIRRSYRIGPARWIAISVTGIWLYMLFKSGNFVEIDPSGNTERINTFWKLFVEISLIINLIIQATMIAVFKLSQQKQHNGQ